MSAESQGPGAPESHRVGEHWGRGNPIPRIQEFISSLDVEKKERNKKIDEEIEEKRKQGLPGTEEEVTRGQRGPQDDETVAHRQREVSKRKTRIVTDPTTGRDIEVEDQDEESMDAVKNNTVVVPNANLGKETSIKTDSQQPPEEYKKNQDVSAPPDPVAQGATSDVPIRGEKTNVLFHPTPSVTHEPTFDRLGRRAGELCVAIAVAIVFLGKVFGGSLLGLLPLAGCIATGVWLWMKEVVRSGREVEWSSEQLRGDTATANLLPESVEWINTFVEVIWGLMNPEMLAPMADTIEDIMQASAPGAVENVRVAEIDQGSNALRILSMRALPDEHIEHMKENISEENKKKDPEEAKAIEEAGSYYNIEASFAYHAKPSAGSTSERARNMHMQLVFYLGMRGLFGVPFPVFVELIELVGTVRLRLQMSPEPPFLKNLTFSLVGFPHVRAGCTPMFRTGVNVLNIPVISNFVNYAIRTASSLFAAPKSMTMNMDAVLKGDEIHKETQALGIMWVRIYRAAGLSRQDRRGSEGGGSDPYINLSFSKYGKPMYCTRVITDDCNPIWEEMASLLVTPDLIKVNEQLSIELWDSDRSTSDDMVGKVQLPIREMLQHPGKMYPQVSKLQGLNQGSDMPGRLHWELGYFGKPSVRPELRSDGKAKDLPPSLQDNPALQDEKGGMNSPHDDAVAHTPPDPIWPSAILHVVLHQIVNLQVADTKGSRGSRKGREYEPARPYGESMEEQGEHLPTSYCKVNLNDQVVYRTRAKAVSSKPIFNTSTERFVRDWRSAIVTVTVRSQRYREHDPILGVVPLKLSEIFQSSSQVTRWYPLGGGIGFGRIRISLLLRHIEIKLPPSLIGWDVGTFEFTSNRITVRNFNHRAKIKLRTGGSSVKIHRNRCHIEGNDMSIDLSDQRFRDGIRLPVIHRYRSPVVFEFHSHGKPGNGASGYAMVWLQHLVDNEDTSIDIPIWSTKNGNRLTQNYITEANWQAKEIHGLDDMREIGRLQFRATFTPGIDESHGRFVVDDDSRENYEAWEACVANGARSRRVSSDIPQEVESLHEKSLVDSRDVLKQADPEERQRWIDKQGQDWSGAFGQDPRAYMDSRGRKVAEPGRESPKHDPVNPPDDSGRQSTGEESDASEETGDEGSDESIRPSAVNPSERGQESTEEMNKRMDRRQQRGLMQWKPARNAAFARDEAKYALGKMKKKVGAGDLTGREPDIETET